MKIAKYLFLELLFIAFAIMWSTQITKDLKPQEICIAYALPNNNYLEFDWNSYFHWFRSDENLACRFTSFDTWAFFIPLIIFYTGLKGYGSERWHKSVTWQIIIPEICIYLFVYLAFLFNQSGFIMTIGSFLNATLGAIMFGLPLIVYAFFIALANSRYITP